MFEFKDNPDLKNIIELRNINQSYDGGQSFVLKDLDLIIEDKPEQGQFVCILGPSGSGKSTVLRFIANLQKPTSGDVLINGVPVSEETRVSMVFQQYSSLPWMTVLDNVSLALKFKGLNKKDRDEQAMEMIKLVGLEGHHKKYAQYPALSGGQLQRVAIARSLLANSKIILMDEPFGALDIRTRLQMQDLLEDLWLKFKPTIIFVTHDISEAVYLGDDIYILKNAPAKFTKHVHVDLPFNRTREVKRQTRFTELVHHVEDLMVEVQVDHS
ncbi:UNVERIFIED_CONTAM: hypothetical protein GTU68_037267 [Idotea baltica]|nr:hypothetical protein [Idotea baltica]